MSDISIQFYALPDELLTLAAEAVAEFNVRVVAMRYGPFAAVEIDTGELRSVFTGSSALREIAFVLHQPHLAARGRMEFIDKNPDLLSLQIGRQTEHGLEESCLSGRTAKADTLALWNRIVGKLRARTKKGITAINRQSGATAAFKSARYTEGAKRLEATGVPMVPPQGPQGPRIVLGLPDAVGSDG